MEYKLPEAIPDSAREVRVLLMLRCGMEGPHPYFPYRVWSVVAGREYSVSKYGERYQQNAISFDSDSIWLPVSAADRVIRAQSDSVEKHSHGLHLWVDAYRE